MKWPVVFLVAMLLIAHLFVVVWRQPKRRWLYIDYVWIIVGTLGLFGAIAKVRQIDADQRADEASSRFQRSIQPVENMLIGVSMLRQDELRKIVQQASEQASKELNAKMQKKTTLLPNGIPIRLPNIKVSVEIEDVGQLQRKAMALKEILSSYEIDHEWYEHFSQFAAKSDNITVSTFVGKIEIGVPVFKTALAAVQDAHQAQQQMNAAKADRKENSFEVSLALVFPYLFGLGAALRIARASAEIRGFKE